MSKKDEIAVLLSGEIDHHRVKTLREELDRVIEVSRPKKLVLDFTGVTMMDSSGIGLMIGRYKKLRDHDGKLCVRNISSRMDMIFRASGLYQVIEKL